MIRGVIIAPKKVITGAFTLRFSFWREIEFSMADIRVETLEGDALGHSKDCFSGSGANYYILCYIPDARSGKSRISVDKEGVAVEPVIVEYDTVKTVTATWGTPIRRGSKLELPIAFDVPIQKLKKRNFRCSQPCPYQLYGSDANYTLVIPSQISETPWTLTAYGTVQKANGIPAVVTVSSVSVNSGQSPVAS